MEIKEITSKIIWENFISQYSPSGLFQSWNWGETIIKMQNSKVKSQNIWRWGMYENNNLIGIAQIVKVTARRGSFLHIRHGPIFISWQKKYLDFFIKNIKLFAQDQKTIFIRISPLIANDIENKEKLHKYGFHDASIHRMDGEVSWVIDLGQKEEQILAGMRKTTRYLIKQAQKLGVKIIIKTEINEINEFIKLYEITSQRQHFVKHQSIKEEFETFSRDKQILLFEGYYQDKLLGAALIIFYNHQSIYHHSASIQQKIPVNYLLQWEVIKESMRRGKKLYNLWGIADDNNQRHPWKGITIFKKGFGGETQEFLHAQDLPISPLYFFTYSIETFRKIRKGY